MTSAGAIRLDEPAAERLTMRTVLASPERSHGDGIGYVGRLLERGLAAIGEAPRVIEVPVSSGPVPLRARAQFAARMLAVQARAGTDLVLYNHVGLARVQELVPARFRRAHAVFVHGIEVWDAALDATRTTALRSAALRIANSHFTARRVAALHPTIGPVVACPLALLPEVADDEGAVDLPLLNRVGPRAALIVGRMSASERYKGHDELLECWRDVLNALPDAQLLIAGGGDDVGRLRARCGALGLSERVIFCGRVSEATKHALLRRAAVFAMPSRGEGFGLVYLEAMRAGLACIGSRRDAAGDVIADGETGLLVDPAERGDLAAALVALLRDPGVARRMGAAGRARFEREFTFARFCDRLGRALATVQPAAPAGVR